MDGPFACLFSLCFLLFSFLAFFRSLTELFRELAKCLNYGEMKRMFFRYAFNDSPKVLVTLLENINVTTL